MKKFLIITAAVIALLVIIFLIYIISGLNYTLTVKEYTFDTDKVSAKIRLAFVSDLHCSEFGENNSELIARITEYAPDAILLGGDIFDEEDRIDIGTSFLKKIAELYPVYAVMGNHERKMENHTVTEMRDIYRSCNVTVLNNENLVFETEDAKINICGADMYTEGLLPEEGWKDKALAGIDTENYTILLHHRPDMWDEFTDRNIDLMLSGHTHGGQWRVPGILNGILAPDQGFFPKHAGGLYEFEDGMSLVVSRGLATVNTVVPRVYNPPELVLITIE